MSASIISETWHEAQLEETKIESKINEFPSFHYCVNVVVGSEGNRSPDWLDVFIFPSTRIRNEIGPGGASVVSKEDSKVSASCNNRHTLRLHDLITFSFYFDSKATAKRSLAKLAACVSARGHKDRIFSELASNTITPNVLSDNLGRKSFSSYRCDQRENAFPRFHNRSRE